MQKDERRTENRSRRSKSIIVAAIILMLCLITTCVVGTTLAKYTTSGTGKDEARVAKWGVNITINGDKLFNNTYENPSASAVTVKATSDVVAPGTSGSTTFSIEGKPEVSLKIKIDFDYTYDVCLKSGYNSSITSDYYPIKFTLKQIGDYTTTPVNTVLYNGVTRLEDVSLATIKDFLNGWSQEYGPNTDLKSTYELSWKWSFDGNDTADTILGNLMAENIGEGGEKIGTYYSLLVDYTLTVEATQID